MHTDMRLARIVSSLIISCPIDKLYMCHPPSINKPPIIVFSGTKDLKEVFRYDLKIKPKNWPPNNSEAGFVHAGFADRTQLILGEIQDFVNKYDNFIIGGWSLGGSCAILSASALQNEGKQINSVITFGTPRLASKRFQLFYKKQDLWDKTINYFTPKDPIVTKIPKLYKNVGHSKLIQYESENDWSHHDIKVYENCISKEYSDCVMHYNVLMAKYNDWIKHV